MIDFKDWFSRLDKSTPPNYIQHAEINLSYLTVYNSRLLIIDKRHLNIMSTVILIIADIDYLYQTDFQH